MTYIKIDMISSLLLGTVICVYVFESMQCCHVPKTIHKPVVLRARQPGMLINKQTYTQVYVDCGHPPAHVTFIYDMSQIKE